MQLIIRCSNKSIPRRCISSISAESIAVSGEPKVFCWGVEECCKRKIQITLYTLFSRFLQRKFKFMLVSLKKIIGCKTWTDFFLQIWLLVSFFVPALYSTRPYGTVQQERIQEPWNILSQFYWGLFGTEEELKKNGYPCVVYWIIYLIGRRVWLIPWKWFGQALLVRKVTKT